MLIVGCNSKENVKEENTENATADSEVVVTSDLSNGEDFEWVAEKQKELTVLIKNQLKINEEAVLLALSQISEGELSLSAVLDVDQELDSKSIQELVENMIQLISEDGAFKINKENIVITDSNNKQLN